MTDLGGFVNLHNHSEYSLLDGYGHIEEYIREAVRLGQHALAITDHGNLYALSSFIRICRALSKSTNAKGAAQTPLIMKPIAGIEAYVAPEHPLGAKNTEAVFYGTPDQRDLDVSQRGRYVHLTLIAYNATGYKNLLWLASHSARPENMYNKYPRMDFDMIQSHHEGLIATTGCPSGEVSTRLRLGQKDKAYEYASRMKELFGADHYFVEIMNHDMQGDLEKGLLPQLVQLSQDLDIPLLATNDSHYARKEDSIHQEEMLALNSGAYSMKEPRKSEGGRRFAFDGDNYCLRSYEEMITLFPDDKYPNAVSNTVRIANMVEDWYTSSDDDSFLTDNGFTVYKVDDHMYSGEPLIITDDMQRLIDSDKVAVGYYDMSTRSDLRPTVTIPDGWSEETYLMKKIDEGFQAKRVAWGDDDEILQESIHRVKDIEFPVLRDNNFIQYFLVVKDYIDFAKRNGISIGAGRGSVGGSEIAYLTDISNTDPIKNDLLFERFLNPERKTPPDVDTDILPSRRDEVLDYICNTYGRDNIANIITFQTNKIRGAVKDSLRLYGYEPYIQDKASKLVPANIDGKEPTFDDLYNPHSPFYELAGELREYLSGDEFDVVKRCIRGIIDRVKGTGVHACGLIMSSHPLYEVAPVTFNHKIKDGEKWGLYTTQWTYEDCEALGLIKMDLLGLDTLDIISGAIRGIHTFNTSLDNIIDSYKARGKDTSKAEALRIPNPHFKQHIHVGLDDKATYRMLSRGASNGVFQLSGEGVQQLLTRVKPTSLSDVSAITALYRPGPMGMNAHLDYADRKNGVKESFVIDEQLNKVFVGTPVEEVLKPTYQLVVYQEQVMSISRKLAGFTRGQADDLRKAMGHKKPEVLARIKPEFIKGALDNAKKNGYTYTEADLNRLWSYFEEFSKYAFNKSHSVSYAINIYQTAWLKAHAPVVFTATMLDSKANDKDKVTQYTQEIRENGYRVGAVDINLSQLNVTAVPRIGDNPFDIIFGFNMVKGASTASVQAIFNTREKQPHRMFESFHDFMCAIAPTNMVNSSTLRALALAGAFDCFGISRRAVSYQEKANKDQGKKKVDYAKNILDYYKKATQSNTHMAHSVFASLLSVSPDSPKSITPYELESEDYPYLERLLLEKQVTGACLSASPFANLGCAFATYQDNNRQAKYRLTTIEDIVENPSAYSSVSSQGYDYGLPVQLYVLLDSYELLTLRSGNGNFARGVLSDKSGVSLPFFMSSAKYQGFLKEGGQLDTKTLYRLEGRVRSGKELSIDSLHALYIDESAQIPFVVHYDGASKDDMANYTQFIAWLSSHVSTDTNPDVTAPLYIEWVNYRDDTGALISRVEKTGYRIPLATQDDVIAVEKIIGHQRVVSV